MLGPDTGRPPGVGIMKKAIEEVGNWVAGIANAARLESNPHRRAILENYYQHVALEYNGRWEEFLGPDMAIPDPVYRARLGGGARADVYDGHAAVLGFYNALNEETVLTNHDERLAVADWGFASFNTFDMWTTGKHLPSMGITLDDTDPKAHYLVSRPIAMFWNYTSDAKLIGEEVYELSVPTVEKIPASEAPTWEEVRNAVRRFLPDSKLRVFEAA
jgi:hypothetical protein